MGMRFGAARGVAGTHGVEVEESAKHWPGGA